MSDLAFRSATDLCHALRRREVGSLELLDHLLERVIPFFEKHPLKTRKRVDFAKFRRVLLQMERGEHLTEEGVEEIRRIASQMNRGQPR